MSTEERAMRYHSKTGHYDRWTRTCTVAPLGGDGHDGHDGSPVLAYTGTGNISETDGLNGKLGTNAGNVHSSPAVGFCRTREYPRMTTIESVPLGRFGELEPRLFEFASTEQRYDAGNWPCEPQAGGGKGGKWGKSGRRTRSNTSTADVDSIASDGRGSSLFVHRAGPVRNDRIEGACV